MIKIAHNLISESIVFLPEDYVSQAQRSLERFDASAGGLVMDLNPSTS
jgi:hypothetical protein